MDITTLRVNPDFGFVYFMLIVVNGFSDICTYFSFIDYKEEGNYQDVEPASRKCKLLKYLKLSEIML